MPHTFSIHEFHWNPRRFHSTETEVAAAVDTLNSLTDEQKKAVRLLALSRYEEGWDGHRTQDDDHE